MVASSCVSRSSGPSSGRHATLRRSISDPSWPYLWSTEHVIDYCAFAETLPHVEGTGRRRTSRWSPGRCSLTACVWLAASARSATTAVHRLYESRAQGREACSLVDPAALLLSQGRRERPTGQNCGHDGAQSRIVFDVARRWSQRSPALRDAYGLTVYANSITCDENAAGCSR